MTLREALCFAIEHLRTTADPDDRLAREAARHLERKAERLRVRSEKPALWEHRCFCGDRREKRALLCPACHTATPMALLVEFLAGRPRASAKARRQIVILCKTRMRHGEEVAA